MAEVMVAVVDGPYTFDAHTVLGVIREAWPEAVWTPTPVGMVDPSLGQAVIGGDDGDPPLVVDLLAGGEAISMDGGVERIAELVSRLTAIPDFPDDGSVVLTDWSEDLYPLAPSMSRETVRMAATDVE
ncbi:hypothetical protein [Cellulomonas timonensis]|uniref:hypothetical protein n=1 Tax=Cellulomonas timonensis TaxID=1689271 RepID=UPI000A4C90C3|nr:hypothetical protein [Cellulomonas timonensis]